MKQFKSKSGSKKATDFIHLSTANALKRPDKYSHINKSLINMFRESLGSDYPIFIAGSIITPNQAQQVLSEGASFVALGVIAICNAHWAELSKDPNYKPVLPPYDFEQLSKQKVSK
ncbi:hypothetical protein [Fluviispira multicolorata]|uniref:NADH:flavin oxidoreductase / NADH oxidase family protein n=1 Tax=Fluviispira multicolorata TaxID=2654512 RepID=A0A833JCS7_9BACT|nr:hypothetical protein [Fluviispira multicolorata]KAB8030888.1 hypothetical protein GCL57_07900 [Fluviispira multicolorata]